MIEWLLKWMFVSDHEEGITLANALLYEAYLQPVGVRSKSSFKSSRKTNDMGFCDEDKALYRFVSLFKNVISVMHLLIILESFYIWFTLIGQDP